MTASPIFSKEYKDKNGVYTLSTYFPNEDEGTIVVNHVASTKKKVYIEYPECYIEVLYPSGTINAHLFDDEDQFKKFLYDWSESWGADFWKELNSRQLI